MIAFAPADIIHPILIVSIDTTERWLYKRGYTTIGDNGCWKSNTHAVCTTVRPWKSDLTQVDGMEIPTRILVVQNNLTPNHSPKKLPSWG